MDAKILLTDIETAPAKAFVFGLFNQNIGLSQIIEPDHMMGLGLKWYGKNGPVKWYSEYHDDRTTMLTKTAEYLDEADIVVGYNSRRFDVPWIRAELAREGIDQPSPFKQIDLFRVIKSNMRFLSHKLDFVSGELLNDHKVKHQGFDLWRDCLIGDEVAKAKAWAKMRTYCKKDVALLEPLLEQCWQFLPVNVNMSLYAPDDGERRCAKCGQTDTLQSRGLALTGQTAYRRLWCNPNVGGCGGWTRLTQSVQRVSQVGVAQ